MSIFLFTFINVPTNNVLPPTDVTKYTNITVTSSPMSLPDSSIPQTETQHQGKLALHPLTASIPSARPTAPDTCPTAWHGESAPS
jgi:hypothetical protein